MSFRYGWRGPNIVKDNMTLYLDASSPNSYYPLSNSTIWKDISSNGYNASILNGVTYNTTTKHFQLDGTNQLIRISPGNNNLAPTTTNFTFQAWLNFGGFTGTARQIWWGHAGGGSAGFGLFLSNTNNNLVLEVFGTSGGRQQINLGSMTSYLNVWKQFTVVVTQENFKIQFYLDNSLINTFTLSNWGVINPIGGEAAMQIGALNTSPAIWYYNGKIGSIMIYKKALNSNEILQNFNATKTRFGL